MISDRKRVLALLVLVTVLGYAIPAFPVQAKENFRSAKIDSIIGEVHIRRGGDKEIAAFEGMRLEAGDTLLTGDASQAVIEIDSDKTVDVDENTEITLDTLAGNEKKSRTGISVFFGNIVNSIRNKLTDGSTYETTTSTAVMGVRGTTYLVSQPAGETQIMVSGGIVAVSQVPARGSEQTGESVPVTKGNQYQCASDGQIHEAVPVNADSLMALTPGVAKALVTEELLGTVADLPESFTTVSQLVEVLSVQQKEIKQQTQQRIDEKTAAVELQRDAEPAAFFESKENRLTGQKPDLMITSPAPSVTQSSVEPKTPEKTEQKAQTNPAQKEAVPSGKAGPEPASNPADSGKANAGPGVSNVGGEKPGLPSEQNPDGKPSSGPDQDSAGKPGSSTDQDSGSDSSSDGDSGGSSGDHDDGSDDNQGSVPPEPIKVTVRGIAQNQVYFLPPDSIQPVKVDGLAISWANSDKATGYKLEIQHSGGAYTEVDGSYQEDNTGTVCRYLYTSADTSDTYLRITPLTGGGYTAVPAEVKLNFSSAWLVLQKLAAPEVMAISQSEAPNSGFIVSFQAVEEARLYQIKIYQDDILIEDELLTKDELLIEDVSLSASAPESRILAQYMVKTKNLTGQIRIEMRALGDNFEFYSSDLNREFEVPISSVSNRLLAIPKEGIMLDSPEAKITCEEAGTMITWPAVSHAEGYLVEGRMDGEDFIITEGFESQALDMVTYSFPDMDLDSFELLRIKSIGDGEVYLDSDWWEIDLSMDEPQEIPTLPPAMDVPVPENPELPEDSDPGGDQGDDEESDETITEETETDETVTEETETEETETDETETDETETEETVTEETETEETETEETVTEETETEETVTEEAVADESTADKTPAAETAAVETFSVKQDFGGQENL